MTEKERCKRGVELLKKEYPDSVCSLAYDDPFKLLVAVRLSAQCTDKRVNMVTPKLFERFGDARAFAEADPDEIGEIIKSCGLYKTKARDLVLMSKALVQRFNGQVPDNIDDLTTLPGVGRKTANLIVGDVYGKPAVVCDTHFIRIMNRLGFVDSKDPLKVEKHMRELLQENESGDFCHRVVDHGRAVCTARNPRCETCVLKEICKTAINREEGI